jgi:hypothetical protein
MSKFLEAKEAHRIEIESLTANSSSLMYVRDD